MLSNKCIVIPAAGASTRLGRTKQLVEFEGKSLIRRAVDEALDACPNVIVVTGCEHTAVSRELVGTPAIPVDNPEWEEGMGRSISVGVQAAIDRWPGLDGVMIYLCDLPTIGSDHLKNVFSCQLKTGADLIFTKYEDTGGVPALFGCKFFGDLVSLEGDRGAKHLITRLDAARKDYVEFEGAFVDVDLPENLADFG
ncbi:MAG: nucleotidyltransferase family protein [Acidobacteriota bacterium]|nr:nucleotidyltransferase family protein [Acidobacteriota bacterium]